MQPSIQTKTMFKGLASPFGVASHCHSHCCARVAQQIRVVLTCSSLRLPPPFEGSLHSVHAHPEGHVSNDGYRSRSLPDLTGHLTARAYGGHATPLGSSVKPFRLNFILPSPLVRFPALIPIKPHAALLVCLPANSFKFRPCDRTSQVACLTPSFRHCTISGIVQHLACSVYGQDYSGI